MPKSDLSLEARDLGCDRGGAAIVRGVSFALKAGEALQIFGANGAGKSTLLSVLSGAVRPAAGEHVWRFGDEQSVNRPLAGMAVYLSHERPIKPALSVRENLDYWAALYGSEKSAAAAALEETGLALLSEQKAGRISAGQKKRLDLARAIIANRPFWLMDEPAAALDTDGDALAASIIRRHQERGGCAVIATHDELDIKAYRLRIG